MIALITTILIRVTVTGIVASIAISVSKGSAVSEIVNIGCGLLLIIALMQPIAGFRLPSVRDMFSQSAVSAQEIQEENTNTTLGSIGEALAQLMKEHAQEIGIACTFQVDVARDDAGVLQVDTVTVYHRAADANRRAELSEIIQADCAVGEEGQVFIEK